jgi:hypothetical protein
MGNAARLGRSGARSANPVWKTVSSPFTTKQKSAKTEMMRIMLSSTEQEKGHDIQH